MKLQDLKYGMYAVDTSGEEFLCIGNNTLVNADTFTFGYDFNEDLEYKHFGCSVVTIVKILDNARNTIWEREEFKYPIYKRSKVTGNIVRFDSIDAGEVVFSNNINAIGDYSDIWHDHTNTNNWEEEDVIYDEERGLFDKQLVWCWNNNNKFSRYLKIYDVKYKRTFCTDDGTRGSWGFDNYEPFEGEYPQWAKDAYKHLED